jgi:hypothetical protein
MIVSPFHPNLFMTPYVKDKCRGADNLVSLYSIARSRVARLNQLKPAVPYADVDATFGIAQSPWLSVIMHRNTSDRLTIEGNKEANLFPLYVSLRCVRIREQAHHALAPTTSREHTPYPLKIWLWEK